MKLLGVIILYYPSDTVLRNIRTYLDSLDKLMVWDNTPAEERKALLWERPDKIIAAGNGKNEGIGYALNQAVDYLRQEGFTHLVTFDQDSYFQEGEFERYLQSVRAFGLDKPAIFSTNYYLLSQQATYYPVSDRVDEVASCMTSGSIYSAALFRKLGRFREDLFVWGIDCEFSWRAKRQGIPTLSFKHILLRHDLGYQKQKRKLLGKDVFPNEYGPVRSYFNVRNGLVLHREYPEALDRKAHLRYHLYKRIVFILLYESQKCAKLKALFYGYIHGKKGVTGACKITF